MILIQRPFQILKVTFQGEKATSTFKTLKESDIMYLPFERKGKIFVFPKIWCINQIFV